MEKPLKVFLTKEAKTVITVSEEGGSGKEHTVAGFFLGIHPHLFHALVWSDMPVRFAIWGFFVYFMYVSIL